MSFDCSGIYNNWFEKQINIDHSENRSVPKKKLILSAFFFFKLKIIVKFYDDSLDLFWYVIWKSNWKRNAQVSPRSLCESSMVQY